METKILRLPQVLDLRGTSRSKHYDDVKQGTFTKPVKISARSCGWPANEVQALNAARIAGKTDDEIRTLVAKLEAARKLAA